MLLEYCLVLGFVVPVILPLAWCTFVLHLAVFYRANISGSAVKLVMDTKPSSLYLHGSLMVGCALMMWVVHAVVPKRLHCNFDQGFDGVGVVGDMWVW